MTKACPDVTTADRGRSLDNESSGEGPEATVAFLGGPDSNQTQDGCQHGLLSGVLSYHRISTPGRSTLWGQSPDSFHVLSKCPPVLCS